MGATKCSVVWYDRRALRKTAPISGFLRLQAVVSLLWGEGRLPGSKCLYMGEGGGAEIVYLRVMQVGEMEGKNAGAWSNTKYILEILGRRENQPERERETVS